LSQFLLVILFKVINRTDVHIPGSTRGNASQDGGTQIANRPTPTDLDLGIVDHQAVTGSLLEEGGRGIRIGECDELKIGASQLRDQETHSPPHTA